MSLSVQIQKQLGSFSLDVCLETQGELLALLGASGCGKSMTLKCIAGIQRPDSGRIVLDGRVLFDSAAGIDLPPQQRRVGYLFQQYALFPHMSVRQNLEAPLHRLPRAERERRIAEKIAVFRLEGLERHHPAQLSSGQQQRVALARMLLAEPSLLLLDEPFSALDDALKWKLELELAELLGRYAGDVLFVSHSRDEVTRLCKKVCVLTQGRSGPVTTVQELMRSPRTKSAAQISGCKNFSRAEAHDGIIHCPDWGWQLRFSAALPDRLAWVGIRAHSLRFSPAQNALDCVLVRVIDNVFSYILMLQTPAGGLLRMEYDKGFAQPPQVGSACTVYAAPEDILLLTD